MDDYQIIRQIGGGGYGEVFQCSFRGGIVATKVQFDLPHLDAERFKKEVRILTRLNHPNIVTVLHAQLSSNPYWFVMPCYDKSLKDVLPDLPGNESSIEHIFGGVLDGVEHAHDNGVIHRDLKPGNILLNDGGEVVVADFGLGRQTTSDSARLTRTTASSVGTIEYMAPEQRANFKNCDLRSDIFSLGVILYEMYTGEESFLGAHEFTRLPAGVSRVVRTCMDRNVGRRFQSVADLKAAFATAVNRQADYTSQEELRSLIDRIKRGERRSSDSKVAIRLIVKGPDSLEEYHETVMLLQPEEFADAVQSTPERGLVAISRFVESTRANTSYEFRYVDKIAARLSKLHKSIRHEPMRSELARCAVGMALEWANYEARAVALGMLSTTTGEVEVTAALEYLYSLSVDNLRWLVVEDRFRKLHSPFGPYFSVNG